MEEWIRRNHEQVNFYLTQSSEVHGCYRAYLYKYGHDVEHGHVEIQTKQKSVYYLLARATNADEISWRGQSDSK